MTETELVVVISGVTSGIGRALYREFAKRPGCVVAGCGRRRDRLEALRAESGGDVERVDVTDDAAVDTWAKRVISTYGAPDLVVANSGVMPKEAAVRAWEIEANVFDGVMRVNVHGVANMARSFLPGMVERNRGAFVATSSGSGRSTGAKKGAYSTSKFAVEAYVKCVAHSLRPPMLAVPLAPGTLRTEINLNPQLPAADDWAVAAVPFLLNLLRKPHLNGASLSVPGFYDKAYVDTWIIRDGQPLLDEPHALTASHKKLSFLSPSWVGPAAAAVLLTTFAAAAFRTSIIVGLLRRRA